MGKEKLLCPPRCWKKLLRLFEWLTFSENSNVASEKFPLMPVRLSLHYASVTRPRAHAAVDVVRPTVIGGACSVKIKRKIEKVHF